MNAHAHTHTHTQLQVKAEQMFLRSLISKVCAHLQTLPQSNFTILLLSQAYNYPIDRCILFMDIQSEVIYPSMLKPKGVKCLG